MTDFKKDYQSVNPKPAFYSVLIPRIKEIALGYGYTIAIHGSMLRDLDLLAVAWNKDSSTDYESMMDDIQKAIGGTMFINELAHLGKENKPHGRISYCLNFIGDWYVDISVIPPFDSLNAKTNVAE